jgi:hypothetical protein
MADCINRGMPFLQIKGMKPQGIPRRFIVLFCSVLLLLLSSGFSSAQEYSLETSEIEKKPYQIGGYAELRPLMFGLNKDGSLYKLKFYDRKKRDNIYEFNSALQLEGSLEYGMARAYLRTNTVYKKSYQGEDQSTTIQEGYISLKPASSLKIDAGKKTLNWGKGYAWNPVAFLDRPKDPDDPELSREGFIMLSADYIKSFDGLLKTFSFTPVLFPEYEYVNSTYATANRMNFAGKLYFLLYDTDIDFIAVAGGSKTTRYGIDFSRNITTNLEVHGEFAWINHYTRRFLDGSGNIQQTTYNAKSFLLGLRYLTEREATFILEYYRNDTGFTSNEMRDYYSFINKGYSSYLSTGNTMPLQKAEMLTTGNYGRPNPMRDYLYLRASQKEPFDILYLTPAITFIGNVDDKSLSISPELVYTGVTNLELRLKAIVLAGSRNSDFGEKQNSYKVELRARYYF